MPVHNLNAPVISTLASLLLALTMCLAATAGAASVDCMNTGSALEYWRPVRENATSADSNANELAIELLSCLGSTDPELRDRIGYELFVTWLRGEMLTDETRRTLLSRLSEMMRIPPAAEPGNTTLSRSFSALVLSEIMRSDSPRAPPSRSMATQWGRAERSSSR